MRTLETDNQSPTERDWEPCTKGEELAFWLLIAGLVGLLVTIGSLIRNAFTGA